MADDYLILSEIKKAIRRNAKAEMVDLDNQFTHKFDFTVQRFSELFHDTNRAVAPNKWSYFRIGLITQGSAEFLTGIHKFKAPKNTLVVVPARVVTSSKNWSMDVEGYIILFNIDFFLQNNFTHKYIEGKKILSASLQPFIQLNDKDAEDIAIVFEAILKERQGRSNYANELVLVKIVELLIMSERLFDEQLHFDANQPYLDIMKRFIDLLEAHFLQERSVKFYADQLALHPNYLNAIVKKHTGITAKESIQNKLLLEAKYLLLSTNYSIKEISTQVGFNDPNYFTSFFKRFENVSPGVYRSQFL